jgi:hypothetical protein
MKARVQWLVVAWMLAMVVPAVCRAQASTAGNAVRDIHVGQSVQLYLSDAETEKWYRYYLQNGRSYCAEVGSYEYSNTQSDPVVTVYRSDSTTAIGNNDDAFGEPYSSRGSRVCFVSPETNWIFVKVTDLPAGTNYYTLRLVETTIWSSWFFVGGDYNSFVLLRNTTSQNVNYTMTWRNPAGAIVGSTSGTVSPNAAIVLNTRAYVTNPAEVNGSVDVAHNGSPQALGGQVTTLSATTGLNFDSAFFQRQTW